MSQFNHNITVKLYNKQNVTANENLYVYFQLMDDFGTIRVDITTESDYNNVTGK